MKRVASPAPAVHEPRLARIAAQIAEPARARMLAYLMGGDYASAGELARAASVAASTASEHLARLQAEGLVVVHARGRHRYFRLADADVARLLEALALVAERDAHARNWASPARQRLRCARSCYGHLAGVLGVRLLEAMLDRGWLHSVTGGYALTRSGAGWLRELGLQDADIAALESGRAGYPCMDWSERRDHLAGPLANRLLAHLLGQGWLRRRAGERSLELTPPGRQALGRWVGLDLDSAA
ncbi:MAG TPA: helix-turn-helix transcriptional regulator [Burkholderiaceae bacterium]|nr:helix-turn-helix transcriptional regulator [Burkholderiaceae bacterium]